MKNLILFFALVLMYSCDSNLVSSDLNSQEGVSISGSYSTMTTIGNHLYAVNTQTLTTFDISDRKHPVVIDKKDVGFRIETLFALEDVLFIGSQLSLHIFELNNERIPVRRSETEYIAFGQDVQPCDPVVSNRSNAFVTLSTDIANGNEGCGSRFSPVNELRIYNVQNLSSPQLENIIQMEEPKGLGLDGNLLFVCEAHNGVKVFDISDINDVRMIESFEGFDAYDLIPNKGVLLVVGPDTIHTFDYTNAHDIKAITVIDL